MEHPLLGHRGGDSPGRLKKRFDRGTRRPASGGAWPGRTIRRRASTRGRGPSARRAGREIPGGVSVVRAAGFVGDAGVVFGEVVQPARLVGFGGLVGPAPVTVRCRRMRSRDPSRASALAQLLLDRSSASPARSSDARRASSRVLDPLKNKIEGSTKTKCYELLLAFAFPI